MSRDLFILCCNVKASSTLEEQYEQDNRTSGLIYSGIYNSNSGINNNILLYEGYNPKVPMRAWAVHIPAKDNSISILVSEDEDGLNTPSEIGLKSGATVIINGGYFSRAHKHMRHIGLLKCRDS